MRILIVGNGWLGNKLKEYLGAEMSVGRLQDLNEAIVENYDVVINAAAKTDIDWCEKNKFETLAINAVDAADVAGVCEATGTKYVFISSACIFESEGSNDWKTELSTPNPGCFYALSKVVGEHLVFEANPDALVVRIRLPISEWPHPRNTLTKIMGYKNLQTNGESITVIEDMLPVLEGLIREDAKGVYHLINEGTISPVEMAEYMGHTDFKAVPKYVVDAEMIKAGRARRVTTLAKSLRTKALPNIIARMPEIANTYKSHL